MHSFHFIDSLLRRGYPSGLKSKYAKAGTIPIR
jgi:hypothetical protein